MWSAASSCKLTQSQARTCSEHPPDLAIRSADKWSRAHQHKWPSKSHRTYQSHIRKVLGVALEEHGERKACDGERDEVFDGPADAAVAHFVHLHRRARPEHQLGPRSCVCAQMESVHVSVQSGGLHRNAFTGGLLLGFGNTERVCVHSRRIAPQTPTQAQRHLASHLSQRRT